MFALHLGKETLNQSTGYLEMLFVRQNRGRQVYVAPLLKKLFRTHLS